MRGRAEVGGAEGVLDLEDGGGLVGVLDLGDGGG